MLDVADDKVGFDHAASVAAPGGLGLPAMGERASSCG
jgi:signal transduction histidine kinase